MYEKTTLDNGLRIVSSTMPHTRSVCVGIFVGTGSRYEEDNLAGISHFIEHLCFKGTERRATSGEISAAIEGVGGMLNGGTDKELTIYWCKVAQPHFPLAADLLTDMLSNSLFASEEIEKERQVIIEEIKMNLDSPQQRVSMLLDEIMWPDQPLGRDIAGSKETVASLTRQNIVDYMEQQYVPGSAIISVAGNISHEDVLDRLRDSFITWKQKTPQTYLPANTEQHHPRLKIEQRDTEQAHLCLAVHGLPIGHPDRFAMDLLNVILGEGMSSRLFLEIRERQGLAYAIHSYADHFLDTGSLGVCAGVDPERLPATIEAIIKELSRLKESIPPLEISKAKELCKGRLLLRMEDTRSVAGWMGGQELLSGKILSIDQVVSKIDSIQPDDLSRVSQNLLAGKNLSLAVVGPVVNGNLESLLKL